MKTKLIVLTIIAVSLMIAGTAIQLRSTLASGTWQTKAPMPTARYGPAVGVIGGKIYVAGGCCAAFSSPYPRFDTTEMYDPVADTWTTKASMPLAVYGGGYGVIGDKLYVVSGQPADNIGSSTNALQIYDSTTDSWSSGPALPVSWNNSTAAAVGGKLYAIGHGTNDLYIYDPSTNVWSPGAARPGGGRYSAGGIEYGGKFYVIGGHDDSAAPLNIVQAYDPGTNSWSARANLPSAQDAPAVAVLNGLIYSAGSSPANNMVQVYDPLANTWTSETPMPTARYSAVAGVVGSTLYVIGGSSGGPPYNLAVNEAFTAAAPPTPTPTPSCVPPPSGLVSWWPGDGLGEDIQDGNDGTLQGGATFAAGMVGDAFSFDGNGQYVAVPDAANLRFTNAITIDLWINPSTSTQDYGAGVVAKTENYYGDYAIDFVNGDLRFFFYDGTSTAWQVSSPGWLTPAKVGVWSHIAVTYDSSTGALKLYDAGNMIAVTNVPIGTQMGTNNHEFAIGSRQASGSGPYDLSFAGLVDEVEVFDRALDTSEIQAIYNAGSAGKCRTTSTPTPTPTPDPTPTPTPTPFAFTGFFQPVDNLPSLNIATGGSAIPLKFSLSGDQGLGIFASGYPTSGEIGCDANEPGTVIQDTVNAGGSSLSYDATNDQYNYVWKTSKAWKGTCRILVVRLIDGTDHFAKFRFK